MPSHQIRVKQNNCDHNKSFTLIVNKLRYRCDNCNKLFASHEVDQMMINQAIKDSKPKDQTESDVA